MTYLVPVEINMEAKSDEEVFGRIAAALELLSGQPLLKPAEEVWGSG